jgi:hypothetical protein
MNKLGEYKVQLQQFSSNQYVQGSKVFLQSNSIVAKFAFLILILILFMMLLSLGSFILSRIFSQDRNPILINGMINSRQMMIIPQNPSEKGAIPILRSNNEREGLEFTWSVWIYIDDFAYKEHEYKHVFHKGNDNIGKGNGGSIEGVNYPNNGPGLYIMPRIDGAGENGNDGTGNVAGLMIVMNSFNEIMENIQVKDLPLHKWVNVIIRVSNQQQLDVYINGTLVKRHMLQGVPKQNYGDVYLSMNGGFSGNTSELRYFEEALGTRQIQSIVRKGPSKSFIAGTMDSKKDTNNYLSTRWFLKSATDV